MAETTTATSWPASTSRLTWRATLRMRSISATDVPPNFMTRRDMLEADSPGKSGLSFSGEVRRPQPAPSGGLADLRQVLRHQLQVGDEIGVFPLLRRGVGQAQQERGMHRDEALDTVAQRQQPAAGCLLYTSPSPRDS